MSPRTLLAVVLTSLVVVFLPLAAVGAPGDLDPSFGSGGTTSTNIGAGKFDQIANAVAVQGDGKIVTAGGVPCSSFTSGSCGPDFVLVRQNANGSLDPTFGGDGIVTTNLGGADAVSALVIQPDGKIVAAGGSVDGAADTRFAIARYNTDGSLDPTFEGDGRVVTPFSSTEGPQAMLLQPDGKLVVAGESSSNFGVVRYEADGDLDLTFDGDGKVVTDFGTSEIAHAIGIQADGRLVVAGEDAINQDIVVARYTTAGALDPLFDTDGKVRTNFGGNEYVRTLAIDPGGAIVVGGGANGEFALVRYLTSGALDPTFDGDGLATTAFGTEPLVEGLVVDGVGRLVAAGSNGLIGTRFAVARFLTTGALDPTFDGDGKLTTAFFAFDAAAQAVALQSDGLIVAAGYAIVDGTGDKDFAVARYQTGGALDPAFDGDGKTTTPVGGTQDAARAVAVQADGKLVVAGQTAARVLTNDAWALARLDASGALDPSFDGDGRVTTDFGGDDEARDVVVQPDGKIVVAGTATTHSLLPVTSRAALPMEASTGTAR